MFTSGPRNLLFTYSNTEPVIPSAARNLPSLIDGPPQGSSLCYASPEMDWKNKLYFGDNLGILKEHIATESVDLIYLDPPFNSSATQSLSVAPVYDRRLLAEEEPAVIDRRYSRGAQAVFQEIVASGPRKLADLVQCSTLGKIDPRCSSGSYSDPNVVAQNLSREVRLLVYGV